MPPPLPPLNALRAFEAAARLASLSAAADELDVTHGAVSRQVATLEAHLNRRLFRRTSRGVVPTAAARRYLRLVQEAFARIRDATVAIRRADRAGVVTVSVLPSFAARWLLPRLPRFHIAHPTIELRITASYHLVDLARDGIDLAIRYGRGGWSGVSAIKLIEERLFPVVAPHDKRSVRRGWRLAALDRAVLLHDNDATAWRRWLAAAGLAGLDATKGRYFDDYNLVLQAAAAGEGVAMGRSVLVEDELAAGRLVKPFAREIDAERAYWLVLAGEPAPRPSVAAFAEWLVREAAGVHKAANVRL